MSTLTKDQIDAIEKRLASQPDIPAGLGTEEAACMSIVIARWITVTQDRMPATMRNSPEWRALLPSAAHSGRDPDLERRRSDLIIAHMWDVTLPLVQPHADLMGYGTAWGEMCTKRTKAAAAGAAAYAAGAAAYAAVYAARAAADAADAATYAYAARAAAADAARAYAADAARAAADAADAAAYAVTYAYAVRAAAADEWKALDPIGLLQQLVDLK